MPSLEQLKLKNGNMLIEPPGEGIIKIGDKELWVPRTSRAKGVVFGTVVAKCDSIDDEDLKLGSKVVASRFNTGIEIEYDGQTFNLLSAGNIIAVVKENDVIKAKGTNVLIEVPEEDITDSGIHLLRAARFGTAIKGPIFSAGDQINDPDFSEGGKAIFERTAATEIELSDKRIFIIEENEIIGMEAENNGR